MADHHYVDPKDQHEAATGVSDHSDLAELYTNPHKEVLGPWMQEADRQEAMKDERDRIQTGLRKSAVRVGLSTSLPIAIGIVLVQFFMTHIIPYKSIPMIFFIIFGFGGYIALTLTLLRWVGEQFHQHNIRSLPITLTTILALFLVAQKVFDLFDGLVGGLIGYGSALIALVVIGIFIATVSIFIWSSQKMHGLVKILVLLLFLGIATAIFYLA